MTDRPNVLFIMTDQQSATTMSCAGNPWVKTPAMDRIAAAGIRFERAYCTNPVCVPSRFSLFTGRMPSVIQLRENAHKHLEKPEAMLRQGIGWKLKEAGYDTFYGGKEHFPNFRAADLGFDYRCENERDELADACTEWLGQPRERPFFMVASFINPHDICLMGINESRQTEQERWLSEHMKLECEMVQQALQRPEGVSEDEFFETYCPPLPDNFGIQENEPEALTHLIDERPFRRMEREQWSEKRWREHRWAYAKLTEKADGQIGRVLDALEENGLRENTLVIFTSDHGDHDASHHLEHKTYFYEEAARIPFLVSMPGVVPEGVVDREHLISNGLDLVPTWCDYCGLEAPEGLEGKSLRPLLESGDDSDCRDTLKMENQIGYAVIHSSYKYVLCDEGENREQLYDLGKDPGETRNYAVDPSCADALAMMRARFTAEFPDKKP